MDCHGVISPMVETKKTSMYFGSLFMSHENNYGFYKKIPSLASLLASICSITLLG